MSSHGNSSENENDHHLYAIYDKERRGLFKYGISGRPLRKNGSSPRANQQVRLFNRVVGWARFFAKIILTGIPGRIRAEEIEDEYIAAYKTKHGEKPPGNN